MVIQVDDLAASRKLIFNFEMWAQCFSLYAAVRIPEQPSLARDLRAYFFSIAAMAKKYPWPSWILYDQSFREEAAWMPDKLWGKEDASLYARYFNGNTTGIPEAGFWYCHTQDHSSARCPHKPPVKKAKQEDTKAAPDEPCKRYNYNDGRCTFGVSCRYPHKCSACGGGAHLLTHCYRLQ